MAGIADFGNWLSGTISTAWDNLKGGLQGNVDRFKNPMEALNDATDWVSSFLDSASGKTAAKQYETTRQDALSQYQEQFNYLQEQNQLAMERSDTAYQRALADMQKAGINPSAAAGFGGGATNGNEPQSIGEYTATPTATASGGAAGISAIASLISPILGAITSKAIADSRNETMKDIAGGKNTTAETIAETNNNTKKDISTAQIQADKELKEAEAKKARADAAHSEYDTEYWKARGGNSGDTREAKDTKEVIYQSKEAVKALQEQQQRTMEEELQASEEYRLIKEYLPDAMLYEIKEIVGHFNNLKTEYKKTHKLNEFQLTKELGLKMGKNLWGNRDKISSLKIALDQNSLNRYLEALYPAEAEARAARRSSH